MKIVISNDHGALELKKEVLAWCAKKGIEVADVGVNENVSVDYPDMAEKAVSEFRKGGSDFGILLCGTGIGISIAANKMKGIRCALLGDLFSAEMCKAHNDANFIAFGGRIKYPVPVTDMIEKYMATKYEGGRHQTRLDKIAKLER